MYQHVEMLNEKLNKHRLVDDCQLVRFSYEDEKNESNECRRIINGTAALSRVCYLKRKRVSMPEDRIELSTPGLLDQCSSH